MNPHLPRRQFVKQFILGTAVSSLGGKLWQASVLADVLPNTPGTLEVRISDYPALQQNFGSVRLGLNPIINPNGPLGPFYPVLINRVSATTYYAMSTRCAHASCIVGVFDEFEGSTLCPCHGSTYAIDGALLGGPSTSALVRYDLKYDGHDLLTIQVPDLGYCVNSSLVQSPTQPRLRLDFGTFDTVEYEVVFRQRVTDAWTKIPFALAPTDPAEQMSLVGNGQPASLFVDRLHGTGFFSVAIKVLDLTSPE